MRAEDWQDAKTNVNVPLCDAAGVRIKEGSGPRERLRVSSVLMSKLTPIAAADPNLYDLQNSDHDPVVANLFGPQEDGIDDQQPGAPML